LSFSLRPLRTYAYWWLRADLHDLLLRHGLRDLD